MKDLYDIIIITDDEVFQFYLTEEENFEILLGKIITSFIVTSLTIKKLNIFSQVLKNYITPSMVRH